MKRLIVAAACATAAVLALSGAAVGATTYACKGDYAIDDPGLQAAIDQGGTINVVGNCLGNWVVSNDVTLQGGSPGATLNGNATDSVLTLSAPTPITLSLENVTITNGHAGSLPSITGGGINAAYAFGATVDLLNSTVSGNSGCFGGGIFLQFSTVNLTSSTVSQNSAIECFDDGAGLIGGGIYAVNGSTVNATNSTISENTAPGESSAVAALASGGGGIWACCSTKLNLTGTTVSRNSSGYYGGGIFMWYVLLNANGSTITGNDTNLLGPAFSYGGGGIDGFISAVTLTNSRVTANSTYGDGGGIEYGDGPGPNDFPSDPLFKGLSLVNSSVDHNTALRGTGGGINHYADDRDSHLLLTNSSVSFNNAPGNNLGRDSGGGGISNHSTDPFGYGVIATVVATGSTFQGNLARNGVGGAIANFSRGRSTALVTLVQTSVGPAPNALNQNQALYGGGIFNHGANANVSLQGGTNIVHNKALLNGGGVFNDCGATTTLIPGALILFNTPNQMFTNLGPCLIN